VRPTLPQACDPAWGPQWARHSGASRLSDALLLESGSGAGCEPLDETDPSIMGTGGGGGSTFGWNHRHFISASDCMGPPSSSGGMDVDESQDSSATSYTDSYTGSGSREYCCWDGSVDYAMDCCSEDQLVNFHGHPGAAAAAPWQNRNFLDIVANSSSSSSCSSATTGTTTTATTTTTGGAAESSLLSSEYGSTQTGSSATDALFVGRL